MRCLPSYALILPISIHLFLSGGHLLSAKMHVAVREGSLEMVQYLYRRGARLTDENGLGDRPLASSAALNIPT